MSVTRVQTANGSHIEPPLDPAWDDLTKLQWLAEVTTLDTGLPVEVTEAQGPRDQRMFGAWLGKRQPGVGRSCSYREFNDCWWFITYAGMGAAAVRGAQ